MCVIGLAICFAAILSAQETAGSISSLEAVARKYQEIGSYESSAIARRSLGAGIFGQVHLKFAYAARRMTPRSLPVPMLPQLTQMGFETVDGQGKPVTDNHGFTGPGPVFDFDQIAWRVEKARKVGMETVHLHPCEIIEVEYQGTRRNRSGEPVKYWIDPITKTIWKMQFSEADPLRQTGQLIRWTVVWDWWRENQPPPTWLTETDSKLLAGKERTALIGKHAPDIIGYSLTGKPFRLSALRGSVVVLDFWATWCGPCAEEMASLEELRASLSGPNVQVWSITESSADNAKRWMAERKRTLSTAIVPSGIVFHSYLVDTLPQVVIVDRNGIVTNQWVGLKRETDLRHALDKLLIP